MSSWFCMFLCNVLRLVHRPRGQIKCQLLVRRGGRGGGGGGEREGRREVRGNREDRGRGGVGRWREREEGKREEGGGKRREISPMLTHSSQLPINYDYIRQ